MNRYMYLASCKTAVSPGVCHLRVRPVSIVQDVRYRVSSFYDEKEREDNNPRGLV